MLGCAALVSAIAEAGRARAAAATTPVAMVRNFTASLLDVGG
jgi:hypothetical protein